MLLKNNYQHLNYRDDVRKPERPTEVVRRINITVHTGKGKFSYLSSARLVHQCLECLKHNFYCCYKKELHKSFLAHLDLSHCQIYRCFIIKKK
ncbi:hypothetical protein XENTR_v10012336 [Xenopus tropicalis]|nr:hypothetical protein XENTR_v10012336 [Xenopus tropicalis]